MLGKVLTTGLRRRKLLTTLGERRPTMTTTHHHTAAGTARVPAGAGRVLMDGPLGAVLLAGAEDTGGRASFVVHPMAPRTLGSPVHIHTHEDEWTYVLDGTVGIQVG